MEETKGSREIALAGRALVALRHSLVDEVGALPAIHALHAAGYEAGEDLAPTFLTGVGGEGPGAEGERLGAVSPSSFWSGVETFFRDRGWGTIQHDAAHPGIGILVARGWAESDPGSDESQPTCQFSAGLLSSLLSRAAGGPVAVLEIECESIGAPACKFAFGGEAAIRELYSELLDGASFDDALDAL